MKRFSTRWCLRASAVPLGVLVAAVHVGCVTRGTHREVVAERDLLRADKQRLEGRVELLEASNQSLGTERLALIDEMENLSQEQGALEKRLRTLRRTEAELSENLAAREADLASQESELSMLQGTYEGLVEDLEEEVAAGQIQIEQLRSGLRLNLTQDVLFASGRANLNTAGAAVVRKVAGRLTRIANPVEVQGHTDDIPISSSRFPSNWELAAARASEVVRLLAREGIEADRLLAVSYGEFHPVASNTTPEGRAKNRRIEIRLEPAPPTPAKADPADAP